MTVLVRIDVTEYGRFMRKLGDRFVPSIKRGIIRGAAHSLVDLQQGTREAVPANPSGVGFGGAVDSGFLLRAWRSRPTPNGAEIWNAAPYAGVVEYGRRPESRMPPRDVIAHWLQRRLQMSPRDAERAAFVVARSIAARGLLPRNILSGALPKITAHLDEDIDAELTLASTGREGGQGA